MHYFQHHIGDFRSGCYNMTRMERALYREMLDIYYDTESPLPDSIDEVCKILGVRDAGEKAMVGEVLALKFQKVDGRGWVHERCETEIARYHALLDTASKAGKASAASRLNKKKASVQPESNADSTPVERPLNDTSTNQQPITNNHKPEEETTTSSSGDDQDLPQSEADDVRACPIGSLVNLYHECMPNNPRVKVLNESRKGSIRQRWREAASLDCEPFGYKTKSAGLEAWKQFFLVCAESTFLTGKASAQPGKPPFVADIDFIMSPTGFAKTLENKYHREVKQ